MRLELAIYLTPIEVLQSQVTELIQILSVKANYLRSPSRILAIDVNTEAVHLAKASGLTKIWLYAQFKYMLNQKKHKSQHSISLHRFIKPNHFFPLNSITTKKTLMNRSIDQIDETSINAGHTFSMWSVFTSFFSKKIQIKKIVGISGKSFELFVRFQRLPQFFCMLTKELLVTQLFSQEVKSI